MSTRQQGSLSHPPSEGTGETRLELVHRFFAGTGSSYDQMVWWATFGIDARWKRLLLDLIPPGAARVLDLACGTGLLTLAIARRFPHSEVVGVELRDEYLALARAKQQREGLRNVQFVLQRAEDYHSDNVFDCITASYLAKYADLPLLVSRAAAMLAPGGRLVMHDFILPPTPALRALWHVYFWALQHVGTRIVPSWREIFYGLPRLIEHTRWLPELLHQLAVQGFEQIEARPLTLHGSALVTAVRPHSTAR